MSLDVLAQHLATKGRNGDTMLVHMTPGEVHGLHALALAHGGQLTINPDTGLPEANFLKKLLPMIAGAALNFFAPGIGTAIGGALGLGGAAGSAIAVGGITGLATGSLQKGLMAGLGAYGGAGLAEGLAALGTQGAAAQLAEQGIAAGAQENARDALLARAAEQTAVPTGLEAAKAGLAQAVKTPSSLITALGGGKNALSLAGMAAAPIMADAMVPTTTGMPTTKPGDTGYVRPFVYDPATFGQGPQGMQALPPVPANQITYPAPPPGGASGGLVALAAGGTAAPAARSLDDIFKELNAVGVKIAQTPRTATQTGTTIDPKAFSAEPQLKNGTVAQYLADNFVTDDERRAIELLIDASGRSGGDPAGGVKAIYDTINSYDTTGNLGKSFGFSAPAAAPAPAPAAAPAPALSRQEQFALAGKPMPTDWHTAGGAFDTAEEKIDYFNQQKFSVDDLRRAKVPEADIQWMLANGFKPTVAAPAPAPVTAPPGTITGGTVTGGGVTTSTTPTTPTFQLTPEQQQITTPTGTITGGTVTGAVDTRAALDEYNATAPTGKPPAVTSAGVLEGYKGTDKTYGGTDKLDQIKLAPLGKAGSVARGTETMQDVRNAVGNRYAAPVFEYKPSVTGASKSAYDYLMGQGAYPTNQTMPAGTPLWKPYVEAVGATPTAFPRLGAPATSGTTGGAQFGFKAPTGGTTLTGTQRWRNSKTGEIYLAPAGYAPPSGDWVIDADSALDLTNSGVGVGSDSAGGATGVGPGSAADGGVGSADGSAYAGGGGITALATGGQYNLGSYSDGGRLLRGPGDGVSDSIPATIGGRQPARLADGEFVIPARIVSELGNGSTEAGARKLYAMMDRVQRARRKTTGKNKVAANTKAERLLPA